MSCQVWKFGWPRGRPCSGPRGGLATELPVVTRHGPVGLLHVDAHTDTADKALGEKVYHGTPFRRCVDEGLLDCERVVQVGIRGSATTLDPYRYSRSQVTKCISLPSRAPGLQSAFLSGARSVAGVDSTGALMTMFRKLGGGGQVCLQRTAWRREGVVSW